MLFLDNLYHVVTTTSDSPESATCRISLMAESTVFAAHFPGEPILPGACIVQLVVELASLWQQRDMRLTGISNVKFLSVIRPDEVTEVDVRLVLKKQADAQYTISATLVSGDTVYSRLTVILQTDL